MFKRNVSKWLFYDNHKILKQNQETAAGSQSSLVQNDLEQFFFGFFVGNKCWSLKTYFKLERCTIKCVRPSTNAFDIALIGHRFLSFLMKILFGWCYIEGVRRGSNTQVYSTAVKYKICHVSFNTCSFWTKEFWGPAAVSWFCLSITVALNCHGTTKSHGETKKTSWSAVVICIWNGTTCNSNTLLARKTAIFRAHDVLLRVWFGSRWRCKLL